MCRSTSNHTWQHTPVKTFSTMRIIYTKPQILRQPNRTYLLENLLEIELPRMIYAEPQVLKPPRNDVLMMTPWFAPIVWEGTYNLEILNEQFKQRNVTVGLTVFAIKK
nr:histo-blood group ABO system transferase-like [Pelodiscus sinensis]|eukprot:XP_025044620.1 histo-blood group ABO system transferase-like [Pelodiscus sinensis]